MNLSEMLYSAAKEYQKAKIMQFKNTPVGDLFKKTIPTKIDEEITNEKYILKGSIGAGQFAEVPWVAIMDKEFTKSTQKGVYIVFLFSVDGKSIYLSLIQGVTYLAADFRVKQKGIADISQQMRLHVMSDPESYNHMDLGATTALAKGYEIADIKSFKYNVDAMPSDEEIHSNINELLEDYKKLTERFINSNKDYDVFYESFISEERNEACKDFKRLLNRFIEQANVNISNQTKRSTTIGDKGFKNNAFNRVRDYDTLIIDKKTIHVHLFSTSSYGPKNGEGSSMLPYFCYYLENGYWVNIRVTFKEFKAKTIRIVLWNEDRNIIPIETGISAEINALDLFNDKAPNSVLIKFFNQYMNISLKEDRGDISMNDTVVKMSNALVANKNIILRGAPGTGKTYLSQQIAAFIISNGVTADLSKIINDDQYSTQLGFVQFHPSYDYTDFVEGLRPMYIQGEIGFKLQKGTFRAFCDEARICAEKYEDKNIAPKYVFIIDEINRGEISKIFGELFFSLDPGYRGIKGSVLTQYANLHTEDDRSFYIPENVHIIGTMNDIDRSVDTFDFAMRRRFTFYEVTAEESAYAMLSSSDTIAVMNRLNDAIVDINIGGLSNDYKIGASYFLEIDGKGVSEDVLNPLWQHKLLPLVTDYFRGERNASYKIDRLREVYFQIQGL